MAANSDLYQMVFMLVDSFPDLKCQTKSCQSSGGICMKSPENFNKEVCYCRSEYFGDSCENRRSSLWNSRVPSNRLEYEENDWNVIYQNLFVAIFLVFFVTVILLGYAFTRSRSKSIISDDNEND